MNEAKITRLNGKNYAVWREQITSLLKSKGLWKFCVIPLANHLVETPSNSKHDEEDEKDEVIEEELMMKDEEAKVRIFTSIDEAQMLATGTCNTAYDLWEKLRINNEGSQNDVKSVALSDLLGIKMARGESINRFCGRFELTLAKLSCAGHKVELDIQLWAFKNAVHNEHKKDVVQWQLNNKSSNVDQLILYMKSINFDDKDRAEKDNSALMSKEKSRWEPRRNQKQTVTNNNTQCSYCGFKNHSWKECRKLKKDKERRKQFGKQGQAQAQASKPPYKKPTDSGPQNKRDPPSTSKSPRSGAFNARLKEYNSRFTPNKFTWVIDSGATSHMTPNIDFLSCYQQFEKPKSIVIGNETELLAYGSGTFHFNSGQYKGRLESVLYVPEIAENLMSVPHALSVGVEINFIINPSRVIFSRDNTIVLCGYKSGSLFLVELKPDKRKTEEFAATSIEDWHQRFNHCSTKTILELVNKNAVTGLRIAQTDKPKCKDCAAGKLCRTSHPTTSRALADENSAVLHFDTCGPLPVASLGGSNYYVLCTEEYSNYKLFRAVKNKKEISDEVKSMINQVTLESKREVRMIKTDNGTEFCKADLNTWLSNQGILHERSAPYTPQQNGTAERGNRSLQEAVRTMLAETNLPETLWAEAANCFIYTSNRLLSPRDRNKTRFEIYYNKKPNVAGLRKFGESAMIKVSEPHRDGKFSEKGSVCIFVGYTSRSNTYRFYDPHSETVINSCDVQFLNTMHKNDICVNDENNIEDAVLIELEDQTLLKQNQSRKASEDNNPDASTSQTTLIQLEEEEDRMFNSTPNNTIVTDDESNYEMANDKTQYRLPPTPEADERIEPTHSYQTRKKTRTEDLIRDPKVPSWFYDKTSESNKHKALFALEDEPRNIKEAQDRDDWLKWKQAMDEEMSALNKNNTWKLVTPPENARPLKNTWVFKLKPAVGNEPERYKARLVAKGYSQIPNRDYKETYAPVASMNSIRTLFAIAVQKNMHIVQFDIKTAFLYGDLDETLYMKFPEGYPNPHNHVCKLIKSLYGLKQAPRQWNRKFNEILTKFNLQRSIFDKCIYYNEDRSLLLAIYVDDGLAISSKKELLNALITNLKQNFELKVMKCEAYLGFKVIHNQERREVILHQAHYVENVLERYKMLDCTPCSTPEEVGTTDLQEDHTPLTEEYPFKELVGSLLYLVTCTRPDIAHAVSLASRTAKPTQVHWNRLKRILRYLKGNPNYGIRFRWEKHPTLVGYSDADYANDAETRKSTTGYCIMFAGGPIAWRCQRQDIIALSTTEAEYISGCELVKEIIPIRETLIELNQIKEEPTPILIDNQSTVKISTKECGNQRTKHIDVRGKWLNEQFEKKKIQPQHIPGTEQAADILTKPLHKTKFANNRSLLLTTIAILTIAVPAKTLQFIETPNLFFVPSELRYHRGSIDYKLNISITNPCDHLFLNITGGQDPDLEANLIHGCRQRATASFARYRFCSRNNNNSSVEKTENTNTDSGRQFRQTFMPLIQIAIDKYFTKPSEGDTKPGLFEASYKIFENLSEQMKNDKSNISNWNSEVHEKLTALQKGADWSAEYTFKIGNAIHYYMHSIERISKLLLEIDATGDATRKMSRSIFELIGQNTTIPDTLEYSSFTKCQLEGNPKGILSLRIEFNLPIVEDNLKLFDAVAIEHYNKTVEDGKTKYCWITYSGPKVIMYNESSDCMSDVPNWRIQNKAVKSQTCINDSESLKGNVKLWTKTNCQEIPDQLKNRIQTRDVNGMFRLYCFPFNITINNKFDGPCPDHPFELDGRSNYNIAGLEHNPEIQNELTVSVSDQLISKTIYERLHRADREEPETGFSLSGAIDKIKSTISLPEGSKTSVLNWLGLNWLEEVGEWFKKAFKHIGMIFVIIGILLVIILAAPILEVLYVIYTIIRGLINVAIAIMRKCMKRTRKNIRDHKLKVHYWKLGNVKKHKDSNV